MLYGLVLAYAKRPAEARAAVARARVAPADVQDLGSYILINAVRIELALGNPSGALDILEKNAALPGMPGPNFLALDPTYASLRGNPRFEKLLK